MQGEEMNSKKTSSENTATENSEMRQSRVPEVYGKMLQWIVLAGLVLLLVTYALYVGGALPSTVPPPQITDYWHLDSEEYIEEVGAETGWEWVSFIGNGDYLCLSIIVLLTAATILCLAVAFFLYLRERDNWYALITGVTVVILILTATGVGGGH